MDKNFTLRFEHRTDGVYCIIHPAGDPISKLVIGKGNSELEALHDATYFISWISMTIAATMVEVTK